MMLGPVVVTGYQPDLLESVVALWRRCFPPELLLQHNDPYSNIARKMAFQPELFFVALAGGPDASSQGSRVVGSSKVLGTTMAGYDGHRGWLYSVAVDPDYRRLGIGRMLLAHAEASLVRLGAAKINLQVRSTNAQVIQFYEQCGYQVEPNASLGKRITSAP